ncbi:MAG: hypothetical protein JKY93_02070 [Gammaproteobacteria bacterium]|nr:hypothetical protein [Gammaproteobacteria bacterium]
MSNLAIHSKPKNEYPDSYHDHAFEQYKIYLEMADRISSRRQSANSFFVTINTVLVTLAGYAKAATSTDTFFYAVTSIAGVLICYIWYRLVLSYKNLNSAKFKVIHAIEADLPYKPYDAEWEAVGRGKNKKLYQPFTNLEIKIPWIFSLIHILVLVYAFPWSVFFSNCMQP